MKPLLKIIVSIVVLLIGLIVLASILLPMFINPNDYKDEIAKQVQQQTGRQLVFSGDINMSVSLPLAVSFELGKTQLENPEAFKALTDKPFVSINQVVATASIMPLLQQNTLKIGEILLDGININLYRSAQGKTNWQDLQGQSKKKSQEQSSSTEMPQIHLAGFKLSNTNILWQDDMAKQKASFTNVNLSISEVVENKPVEINFKGDFSNSNPQIDGQISLKTNAKISMLNSHFELYGTDFKISTTGKIIPGGSNNTELTADIVADLVKQTLKLDNFSISSYGIKLSGQTSVENLSSAPKFSGELEIDNFSPKAVANKLAITLPELKNPNSLEEISALMHFSGTEQRFDMTGLQLKIDNITMNGNASIVNFAKPHFDLGLDIDQIMVEDYLPAQTHQQNQTATANENKQKNIEKTDKDAVIIPVELLKSLNAKGQLKIGKFSVAGAKLDNILVKIDANNGKAQLNPLSSDFYKGKLNLNAMIDVNPKLPKINISQNFSKIDLGDLLQDTVQSKDFTGTADINSSISTMGLSQRQLINNSNGKGKFIIGNGHIEKLDILHTIRKAQLMLKGQTAATESQEKSTEFTELKGSFTLQNGVFRNSDLYTKTPVMQITGKGYADLPKEYLDYTLQVRLLNSLRIDKQSNSNDFRGKTIPYTIKGKFDSLNQQADLKKLLQQKVKEGIKKEAGKLLKGFLPF